MFQMECLNSAPGGFGVPRDARNGVSYPPPLHPGPSQVAPKGKNMTGIRASGATLQVTREEPRKSYAHVGSLRALREARTASHVGDHYWSISTMSQNHHASSPMLDVLRNSWLKPSEKSSARFARRV